MRTVGRSGMPVHAVDAEHGGSCRVFMDKLQDRESCDVCRVENHATLGKVKVGGDRDDAVLDGLATGLLL